MSFTVRRAVAADIDELTRLREERITVYLKSDIRLTRNAAESQLWRAGVLDWMKRDDAAIMVADRDGQLIGYVIGWVWENPPIFELRRMGLVAEMSVDGHCKQGGVGTALFKNLQDWFRAHELRHIEVRIPRQQPIEQAFWRAIGAKPYFDHMYFRLE